MKFEITKNMTIGNFWNLKKLITKNMAIENFWNLKKLITKNMTIENLFFTVTKAQNFTLETFLLTNDIIVVIFK